MSITISGLVTNELIETERRMADDSKVDYSDLKDSAIARAKWMLYGEEKSEGAIADVRIKTYVAKQAVLFMIPACADWYMNKARLSDAKEGATLGYYDRVEVLRAAEVQIRAYLAEHKQEVLDLILDANLDQETIGISTLEAGRRSAKYLVTPDPWKRAEAR